MFNRCSIQAVAAAVLMGMLASSDAQAAGASPGNTSSGNTGTRTSTNTSSNTSTQTSTYSSESQWAEDVYAGRAQGPAARNWLFVHPQPQAK